MLMAKDLIVRIAYNLFKKIISNNELNIIIYRNLIIVYLVIYIIIVKYFCNFVIKQYRSFF
jgi:hypothetical protein